MLHDLLDKRDRAPKQPPNAQVRKDRKWTGGVDDPQPDHHTGKTPSAARSSARLALSSLAALPERGTIRLAACQISIFGITPVGCPVNLY